jgi:hypothetical protein
MLDLVKLSIIFRRWFFLGSCGHRYGYHCIIVQATNGPRYVVGCRRQLEKSKLKPGTRVALDMTTLTIMRYLPREVCNSYSYLVVHSFRIFFFSLAPDVCMRTMPIGGSHVPVRYFFSFTACLFTAIWLFCFAWLQACVYGRLWSLVWLSHLSAFWCLFIPWLLSLVYSFPSGSYLFSDFLCLFRISLGCCLLCVLCQQCLLLIFLLLALVYSLTSGCHSVADPGSGTFLSPGSGIRNRSFRIPDPTITSESLKHFFYFE